MSCIFDKYLSSSKDEDRTINALSQTELKTFVITKHQQQNNLDEIDLDNNYFSHINNECFYYGEQQLNLTMKTDQSLSSLYVNFEH